MWKRTQTAYIVNEYFRVAGAHVAVLDYTDTLSIFLQCDDIQDFDTRWAQTLRSINELPNVNIPESLNKMRLRELNQPQTVFAT